MISSFSYWSVDFLIYFINWELSYAGTTMFAEFIYLFIFIHDQLRSKSFYDVFLFHWNLFTISIDEEAIEILMLPCRSRFLYIPSRKLKVLVWMIFKRDHLLIKLAYWIGSIVFSLFYWSPCKISFNQRALYIWEI